MRYQPFLFEPDISGEQDCQYADGEGGIKIVPTGISNEEAAKYLLECRIVEAVFYTISELFELPDSIELVTGTEWHHFTITKFENETDWNGMRSKKLSREKLKDATPKQISEALIDLLIEHDKWNQPCYGEKINLP